MSTSSSIYAGSDGAEPSTSAFENTLALRRAVMTDVARTVEPVGTSHVDRDLLRTSNIGTVPRVEDASGAPFAATFLSAVMRLGDTDAVDRAEYMYEPTSDAHPRVVASPRAHDDDMYATPRRHEHACANAGTCKGLMLPGGGAVLREFLLPLELAADEEARRRDPNAHLPSRERVCIRCHRVDVAESWVHSYLADRPYELTYEGQLCSSLIGPGEYPESACILPARAGTPYRGIVAPIVKPIVSGEWRRVVEVDRVRYIQPLPVVAADGSSSSSSSDGGGGGQPLKRPRSF